MKTDSAKTVIVL